MRDSIWSPNELYYHGIAGQKWGKKNGPPYPLNAADHSSSEKKAAKSKSDDREFRRASYLKCLIDLHDITADYNVLQDRVLYDFEQAVKSKYGKSLNDLYDEAEKEDSPANTWGPTYKKIFDMEDKFGLNEKLSKIHKEEEKAKNKVIDELIKDWMKEYGNLTYEEFINRFNKT